MIGMHACKPWRNNMTVSCPCFFSSTGVTAKTWICLVTRCLGFSRDLSRWRLKPRATTCRTRYEHTIFILHLYLFFGSSTWTRGSDSQHETVGRVIAIVHGLLRPYSSSSSRAWISSMYAELDIHSREMVCDSLALVGSTMIHVSTLMIQYQMRESL